MSAASDLVTSVGTVLIGLGGTIAGLKIKRDNNDRSEVKRLARENDDLRADVVDLVEYLYSRRLELAAQGITLGEPPKLRSQRARAARDRITE